ncbi:hypothetical protein CAI21_13615 [Alkalilimnicola ehrlichii]|uniref:Ketoreductase domain-containing protein n=1 Tax=Alkalilimnicola ehrlichii TaxID=351052 RepID=A0A3E0WR22_9GAMM|nr:SDR family NAD(P)-dependent oxidoreductase [Alkalilimnicola ehrlichii]RFA27955.1 hypothetical protein CAI21_13615 [Alkalilimnicola ehrlichii]RFA34601.1 hypothetical protein CAL65_14645 [Alkalilimnicola ehrlichii]
MSDSPKKVGLVFGGSSGIGRAIAQRMASEGFAVVVASRRGAAPRGIAPIRCDVRCADDVAAAFEAASMERACVDWVVNAAGVGFYAPFRHGFEQQWQAILDTNVQGLLNIVAALTSPSNKTGHYVHIGSLAGSRPSRTPGNEVYGAAKAAGANILARLRERLREAGDFTKITLVTPGYVGDTEFVRNFFNHATEYSQPLLDSFEPLIPDQVAEIVRYALAAPGNVELSEIVVRPTRQPD